MTKVTPKDIKRLAKLSQIKIENRQIDKFCIQLTRIIDYIGELNEVNTKNIEPTSQTTGLENVTGPDIFTSSIENTDVLKQGKDVYNGYFRVPIIIINKDI